MNHPPTNVVSRRLPHLGCEQRLEGRSKGLDVLGTPYSNDAPALCADTLLGRHIHTCRAVEKGARPKAHTGQLGLQSSHSLGYSSHSSGYSSHSSSGYIAAAGQLMLSSLTSCPSHLLSLSLRSQSLTCLSHFVLFTRCLSLTLIVSDSHSLSIALPHSLSLPLVVISLARWHSVSHVSLLSLDLSLTHSLSLSPTRSLSLLLTRFLSLSLLLFPPPFHNPSL